MVSSFRNPVLGHSAGSLWFWFLFTVVAALSQGCHRISAQDLERKLGIEVKRTYGVPWNVSVEYGVLVDGRDGQSYRTVAIGSKIWMAQNLAYNAFGSWCLENEDDSCRKYGRIYQWSSAMDIGIRYDNDHWQGSDSNHQGICPVDWHVPSDQEWDDLVVFVGGSASAGRVLKATSGWSAEPPALGGHGGDDVVGMRILPGNHGGTAGEAIGHHSMAKFWSSTGRNGRTASNVEFDGETDSSHRGEQVKTDALSLRCIKDVSNGVRN